MVYLLQLLPTYLLHFTYGLSLGYPSILEPQLKNEPRAGLVLDSTSEGLVVSLDYGSTIVISMVAGQLQSKFGPLRTTLSSCIPICLAWIFMALASNMVAVYCSRFLVGLGNGILLSSVYSVEIASADKRGAVVMVELTFRCLGIISASLLGTLLDWKTIAWLITPVPVFIFIYGLFLPESPFFKKAGSGRRNSEDTEWQPLVNHEDGKENSKRCSWLEMFKMRDVWFPFLLCTLNLVGQQAGGMKIIQGFQVEIFSEVYSNHSSRMLHGVSSDSTFDYWASVFLGVVRLVAALMTAKYIKNFGRRTIYLISALMSVILSFVFGLMLYLNTGLRYKYAPLAVISMLTFCVQIGPESFPNLISSEIFPNHSRSNCKGILRAVSSIMSFAVLTYFPTLQTTLGLDGTFFLLALVLLLTLPPTYLYLPEARDVDLNCVSQFYQPQATQFYTQLPPKVSDLILPTPGESKSRIAMICNSFGWSGTCLCDDSRTLLAEGLVCVRGGREGPNHSQWRGSRLVCVFSDVIVLGTVVTPSILHRNMKILHLIDIELREGEGGELKISHAGKYYILGVSGEKEKTQWVTLIKRLKEEQMQQIDRSEQ